MQRNIESMRKQVEVWQQSELTNVTAKVVIYAVSPVTQRFRDKAAAQLGTSGSGNHFVEFGEFTVADKQLGLEPGTYLGLLSHSGSRGTGAQVCEFTAGSPAPSTRICPENSATSRGLTSIPPTAGNIGRRWN